MQRLGLLLARQGRQAAAACGRQSGRCFAAEAASQDALPLPVHGTAGRYASALYLAGSKAKKLDAVDKDLNQIWNVAEDSAPFRNFLKDPSIPKTEKKKALDAILDGIGVSDITKRFVGVLADNNRLGELSKITSTFDELVAAGKGEVTATITTAGGLTNEEMEEIKQGLNELLDKGQTLNIMEKVDPGIIGGLVVDIGDKHIDMSISSRIKKIQQLLQETV